MVRLPLHCIRRIKKKFSECIKILPSWELYTDAQLEAPATGTCGSEYKTLNLDTTEKQEALESSDLKENVVLSSDGCFSELHWYMQKYKILVLGINKNEGSGLFRTKKSLDISLPFMSGRFLMKFNMVYTPCSNVWKGDQQNLQRHLQVD